MRKIKNDGYKRSVLEVQCYIQASQRPASPAASNFRTPPTHLIGLVCNGIVGWHLAFIEWSGVAFAIFRQSAPAG
ncbi:hypothetical protein [Leptolyngbya sp. NIES-2104]|uniref:hypothetical protein n=1 Tax=Leptolyngbya sp. NIES-2104 TaxID=1552121 RepID=UPI0012E38281|nr:hypothetical protein [Leptolyngbya sp. NIES-2104]